MVMIPMNNKQRLWMKIKLVASFYNEDMLFTQEYAKDVYERFINDLPRAIACFEDLYEQTKWMKYEKSNNKMQPK